MKPKILLLQARHADDTARLEELSSFAEMAGLDESNFVPFDLLNGTPSLNDVKRHDALMVGGSGEYYVSKKNLPGFLKVMDLLAAVVDIGHPTFASCFGFQMMVQALGGRIIYDPDNMEVGTYELQLSEVGKKDELFRYLPPTFMAQLGHKDRADRLPEGVINLASSVNSRFQAMRIPEKPIWATQFHPELTREENLKRFHRYLDGYASMMSREEVEETLARFSDSPETKDLIPRFLRTVFD
jgi:GMP synthase (glutamine-hydrolysing)